MLLWNLLARNPRRSGFRYPRLVVEALEDRTVLSFLTAPTYSAGAAPVFVARGDFNGDGIPDLAVANYGTYPDFQGAVSVLLGKGDGTFQSPQSYAVGSNPNSVAVVDL